MNPCEFSVAITALANAITKNIEDDDQLTLVGAAFTQLGDTLSTIAAQRTLCSKVNISANIVI